MSINYRGETFAGYNKPKKARTKTKKFAVLAKSGNTVKLIRYGDANMTIKKSNTKHRKRFRARHRCATATNKVSARHWCCKTCEKKYY